MLVNITEYIIRDPMSQLGQAIEYEYILGDFKTDPSRSSVECFGTAWNKKRISIKSKLGTMKKEKNFERETYLCRTTHVIVQIA